MSKKQYEYPLSSYLNSINLKQGDLSQDERAMQKYPAWAINKCMMQFIDTVMQANEMNAYTNKIDNLLQYQYYLYSIRKSKRFSSWDNKSNVDDIDVVKQCYGYNTDKARQALKVLTREQIEVIKLKLNTGGKR